MNKSKAFISMVQAGDYTGLVAAALGQENAMSALLNVTVLGEPIAKTRPRFVRSLDLPNRGVRTYSDQADKQKQFQWYIRCLAPKFKIQGKEVKLSIELVFNATSKLVDIDNLAKFVLDAGNGFLWEDDRQIEKLVARLNRVDRDPSVEIVLYRSA